MLLDIISELSGNWWGYQFLPQENIGCPSHLDSKGKIGIILIYLNSRITLAEISLLFGVVPSVASDTLSSMHSVVHDYRTEYLRLNQIIKVFNPEYRKYINIEGYEN